LPLAFLACSNPGDEDIDDCLLFFHQHFLIFVDPWLTIWGSLEMQTQVSP
jgi:hypothetical protein